LFGCGSMLQGKSVTVKADEKALAALHEQASKTWVPELATLMQATTDPFINAIFDREPLSKFVWGRVVLVGEAAHPTTPHGLRSTNMSIVDAYTLGSAIQNRRLQGIDAALQEYESRRVLVTAQQVLFSRHLGQLKQGLLLPEKFSWISADQKIRSGLLQQNMHSF
jgi:2-polyprenyl-6-methoxyphenol hydroxylase-like FAD-dependent oxidoreductase